MSKESYAIRVSTRPTEPEAADSSSMLQPICPSPSAQTPLIDIHETPEGLLLEADLPGASEESLTIQLEDNVLSIHARSLPPALEGASLIHQEYRLGEFFRSFILSDDVDRSRITAELCNGVLRLSLPRADRIQSRRIEVRSP